MSIEELGGLPGPAQGFYHRGHRGHRDFGRRARIRGQWEWRDDGVGTGFFSPPRTQRAQRFLVRARRFEGSGNGALSGLVQVFFHHRGTEGTEIFYGGVARIRGQWEWRDVGVGRGLFSPQRHRGHRDFMVGWRGFEVSGNGALSGVRGLFSPQRHRGHRDFW